jgi:polyhydroxyalkanoate synthesis regulator phasin
MADFKKLVISTLLANGQIDNEECAALKKELWADGKIDKNEVKFLSELRKHAQKKAKAQKAAVNPAFTKLFFKAIEDNVLKDGSITGSEAKWLRDTLFADGKIDADDKKFLTKIKKGATKTSPAFDALYEECMAK